MVHYVNMPVPVVTESECILQAADYNVLVNLSTVCKTELK